MTETSQHLWAPCVSQWRNVSSYLPGISHVQVVPCSSCIPLWTSGRCLASPLLQQPTNNYAAKAAARSLSAVSSLVWTSPTLPEFLWIPCAPSPWHLYGSPLDMLQFFMLSPALGRHELNIVLRMQYCKCWVKGISNFPWPFNHFLSNAVIRGTLMAHIHFAVHQDTQVLFCKTLFYPLAPQPLLVHGVIPFQMRTFNLPLLNFTRVSISKFLQAVKSALNGITALQYINC